MRRSYGAGSAGLVADNAARLPLRPPRAVRTVAARPRPAPMAAPPGTADALPLARSAAPSAAPLAAPASVPASALLPGPERLTSLDAFRGATIIGMILVNNPGTWGAIYAPLKHAAWNGWTPTDLIFPFFLFIVGVSTALAFHRALGRGATRASLAGKAGRRALWLFGFGVFMAAFPFFTLEDGAVAGRDYGTLRIMGVLQRIALCYLGAALLYLYASRRARHVTLWALLVGYTLALLFIPVPGAGYPVLNIPAYTLPAWFDRLVLTKPHLWGGAGKVWDPEGLLSTLPALGSTLFGIWAGEVFLSKRTGEAKALLLLLAGVALVVLGYVWDWALPINKSLWTSSYAVFTAGQALCALGAFYWLIDLKGYRRWAQPLVVYGVNAITVFVMSGIVAKTMSAIRVPGGEGSAGVPLQKAVFDSVFAPLGPPKLASLLFALTWIAAWYGVLYVMYKRETLIKI